MSATWVDELERFALPARTDNDEDAPAKQWATPGELAKDLDPRTVQTPALDLIDKALVDVANEPDGRLIIVMAPQEGKSRRASLWFPTWELQRRPDTRIVIASAEHTLARRMGRAVRDGVEQHSDKLGITVRRDLSSQSEWELAGYDGGVFSVGIGGTLVGRPADLAIIDDPIKSRKQADSEDFRREQWDWWTDVLSTRLSPGASVVLILTRWHDDDLAGKLQAAPDGHRWKVLRIPAQADHRPEEGESDPLGREPGEFLKSARGRTLAQWEQIKTNAGSRAWSALYQGRPTPATGNIFPRDCWRFYDHPLWVERADGTRVVQNYDDLVSSWDMTFKDTAGTDMVVGQIWMRRGADCYLLDQVRGRMDFVRTCQEFRLLAARWPQALLKLVEDKANGPAVISALNRIVPGIVPEEPHGSKVARAVAVTPLHEAKNVWIPAPELLASEGERPFAWVGEFIEEHAAFPNGKHDDQVDPHTQALNRMILQPLIEDQFVSDSDLDSELDDFEIANY